MAQQAHLLVRLNDPSCEILPFKDCVCQMCYFNATNELKFSCQFDSTQYQSLSRRSARNHTNNEASLVPVESSCDVSTFTAVVFSSFDPPSHSTSFTLNGRATTAAVPFTYLCSCPKITSNLTKNYPSANKAEKCIQQQQSGTSASEVMTTWCCSNLIIIIYYYHHHLANQLQSSEQEQHVTAIIKSVHKYGLPFAY